MHRRFSSLMKSEKSPAESFSADDTQSETSTVLQEPALVPPSLKVKKVDSYYSRWSKSWKYRNTGSRVTPEGPFLRTGDNDPWKDYSFVVVRELPRDNDDDTSKPTFKIVIKSEYLLKACKDVIQSWPGVSWNADPLELSPEVCITFLDEFESYRDKLAAKKGKDRGTLMDTYVLSTLQHFLKVLTSDYAQTIRTIRHLTSHGEITFATLYAILIPRTLFVTRCPITNATRLLKLESSQLVQVNEHCSYYALDCRAIDLVDLPSTQNVAADKVVVRAAIPSFSGTVNINTLSAYPMRFHNDRDALVQSIKARGQKWVALKGAHHKQFDGIAALRGEKGILRHRVKGRIMVDRATFRRFNPNYRYPEPATSGTNNREDDEATSGRLIHAPRHAQQGQPDASANPVDLALGEAYEETELTEEDLLITPTVVHGFSLSDKLWLEFDVDKISDVDWNKAAFDNLVLPADRKDLLRSLVEAHHRGLGFDDFIKGKGQGLVINLFGPPGVGKTFSAEATSEHVRRPLYLVGAGDLGTDAAALDASLERVFEVATTWQAVVLIDEADVFLEQRSMHDLIRNAMVAVFLRHVEYYRGILFLTTNRVKSFDEAFLSRIHVALHFTDLPIESRRQVWAAFIAKLGASGIVSDAQLSELAKRDINGRQIKNAARTAQSLAVGRGEELAFKHFVSTLDAMDDFTTQFHLHAQA
ncbi:P-loop containing nucleoside triphosphate hydrolase protein [Cylindrobasidium torrendii FP15055 ss-10]|uniref:p-loop containing nucleoside triphosphate hydrolase protein n=1 Tax=Cylindrobasidium torrendii FP15055 ss-10 TaxID=1314674 RepID=A0A0D7B1S9_9AGAR|nr:P-loop containing nucleoside triphosphate hydrolase protein [Cylindrobasidium torrendii FP15055 ss-10]